MNTGSVYVCTGLYSVSSDHVSESPSQVQCLGSYYVLHIHATRKCRVEKQLTLTLEMSLSGQSAALVLTTKRVTTERKHA